MWLLVLGALQVYQMHSIQIALSEFGACLQVQKLPVTLRSSSNAKKVVHPLRYLTLPFFIMSASYQIMTFLFLHWHPYYRARMNKIGSPTACKLRMSEAKRMQLHIRVQKINLFRCHGFKVLCWCHSSMYKCCFKLTGKIFRFSEPWPLLSTW